MIRMSDHFKFGKFKTQYLTKKLYGHLFEFSTMVSVCFQCIWLYNVIWLSLVYFLTSCSGVAKLKHCKHLYTKFFSESKFLQKHCYNFIASPDNLLCFT